MTIKDLIWVFYIVGYVIRFLALHAVTPQIRAWPAVAHRDLAQGTRKPKHESNHIEQLNNSPIINNQNSIQTCHNYKRQNQP